MEGEKLKNKLLSLNWQTIKLEVVGNHILNVQLNRENKLNSLTVQMFYEIEECFRLLNDFDHQHLVVVLTGNGKHFCAGLDLQEGSQLFSQKESDEARSQIQLRQLINFFQQSMYSIGKCRIPVICGIHKSCIGGAIDLLSHTDIRYCTEDAKFSIKEVDVAIVPDIGTLQNLPWKTGNDSLLRELVMTGRFFSAQEAKELGMVSKIFKDKDEMMKGCMETAALIAKKSLVAIYGIKQVFIKQNKQNIEESNDYLALLNQSLFRTKDLGECVNSFFTKKEPKFDSLAQFDKNKQQKEQARQILYQNKQEDKK